jgi:hypothetical protein
MDYDVVFHSVDEWMTEIKRIEKEQHLLAAKSMWSASDELRANELNGRLDEILEKIRIMRLKITESTLTAYH